MARNVTVSCDVGGEEEATTYLLTLPGGKVVEVDLCPKHAAPLLKIADRGRDRDDSQRPAVRSLNDRIRRA